MTGGDQILNRKELALRIGDVLVALKRRQEDGAERALADAMVHVKNVLNLRNLQLQLGDLTYTHKVVRKAILFTNPKQKFPIGFLTITHKMRLELTVFLSHQAGTARSGSGPNGRRRMQGVTGRRGAWGYRVFTG